MMAKLHEKSAKICINKYKVKLIFIIILILQIIFKIVIDFNKNGYYCDEMYSYGLMNYKQAYLTEEKNFMDHWHKNEYYDKYITLDKNDGLNLKQIYKNQIEDYHPILYYVLLRIFSFFSIRGFSKWSGLILNLIIFAFCDLVVFKISKKIFKNDYISLLIMGVYGFSLFSAENTLFIRMYQLLELCLLLLTYWTINNYDIKEDENKKNIIKEYLKLTLIISFGCLTHYYFLTFLVGIIIIFTIRLLRKHRFKEILLLIFTILCSQLLTYLIYPNYFKQISRGSGRSQNTISTGINLKDILSRQKQYLNLLDSNMFFIYLRYIILGILIFEIIILILKKLKKQKLIKANYNSKMNIIIFPLLFDWLYITITSQSITLRYILPIFVFILFAFFYFTNLIIRTLFKNKKSILAIMLIISVICVIPIEGRKIEFQYYESKNNYEIINQYKDIPLIYFYNPNPILENDFMVYYDYVRKFNESFIMEKDKFSIGYLERILYKIDTSNGIILSDTSNTCEGVCKKIIKYTNFSNYTKILEFTKSKKENTYRYFYYIY